MGSSAKKKKEKKKDFQKAKLKVGKTAPKPDNHTSTAFKAKSIVLKQQSLTTNTPTVTGVFVHNLSLLSSKTDTQRKEALASLTNVVVAIPPKDELPQPIAVIMPRLEPLLLDMNQGVRTQLLRLLDALGAYDRIHRQQRTSLSFNSAFEPRIGKILLYLVAALNHLSSSIRETGLDVLTWLLTTVPQDLIATKGGFQKPLITLLTALGWSSSSKATIAEQKSSGWTMAKPTATSINATDKKSRSKLLETLAQLLQAGLQPPAKDPDAIDPAAIWFPLRHGWIQSALPKKGAYDHLELFTPPAARQEEEGNERLATHAERNEWFKKSCLKTVRGGIESAKKEGGEIGRAAKAVERAISQE